jgi:hypothetical protein
MPLPGAWGVGLFCLLFFFFFFFFFFSWFFPPSFLVSHLTRAPVLQARVDGYVA